MNWKRAMVAAFAAVPVLFLFWWGLQQDPNEIASPLPGRAAPEFALRVIAPGEGPLAREVDDTIRMIDSRGKVVVVNFWASWCLACRTEHDALSSTALKYAESPVQFVGVLYNDQPAAGVRWIKGMGGQSYPSVNDPRTRTAIDFGVYGVPETFFIDASGRVARKVVGPVTEALLSKVIDSLLTAAAAGAGEGTEGR